MQVKYVIGLNIISLYSINEEYIFYCHAGENN